MPLDSDTAQLKMTAEEVTSYLDEVFPQRHLSGPPVRIEALRPYGATLRMTFEERFLRPGGTISGPAMFMLADVGLYVAVLGMIGPVGLAVTTNLSINFLRRPKQCDMIGEVELIKLGRRLAVGEVSLFSEGESALAAHATGTYSIPPDG